MDLLKNDACFLAFYPLHDLLELGELELKWLVYSLLFPFVSATKPTKGRKDREWPRHIAVGAVTVPVYRVKHASNRSGWAYVAVYSTPEGRKRQKFADPDAALSEARLQAGKLAAGRVEAAGMSRGERDEWSAACQLAGDVPLLSAMQEWRKVRELCGSELVAAAQAWKDMHGAARKEVSVPEAVTEFLAAKDRQGVDTTASYRKILPRLSSLNLPISKVTTRMLDEWIHVTFRQPGKQQAHPVTFNTARQRLVTLWRWARKRSYLPKAAQTEAEQLDRAREPREQIGILTTAQFAGIVRLLRKDHPKHLAVGVLAGFCGLRRCELHAQKWADVMLDRGQLRVTNAKRNTPAMRLVELPPAAVEWLMLCKREEDGLVSPRWGIDHVRQFAREAEIECPDNAFRHSFISYRVAKTGDVAATALQAGNSASVIFSNYRELVTKAEGEAWFNLTPAAAAKMGEVVEQQKQA
jgi:integrase